MLDHALPDADALKGILADYAAATANAGWVSAERGFEAALDLRRVRTAAGDYVHLNQRCGAANHPAVQISLQQRTILGSFSI